MEIHIREAKDVNLNSASEEELAEDVGLGPGRARRLIEARPFETWDELHRIEGMTEALVVELRGAGAVLGPSSPAEELSHLQTGHERDLLDKSIRADTLRREVQKSSKP
jgi:hypothetical protein